MNPVPMTRREWLKLGAAATAVAGLGARASAQAALPPVCLFSKHLQFMDYPRLAEAVKAIGADGVDLTVRPGGHVLPENLGVDLPRAVEAIRGAGLALPMISTRIASPGDAEAAPTFEAAAAQAIPFIRVGGHKYARSGNPLDELPRIQQDCAGLAALAETHGVTLGYHNHSGDLNFGAPLWDLLRVIEAVGSPRLGSNFDVGHCTAEGPFGDLDLTARALAPQVKMLAVKDFVFEGRRPRWVPLGEGVVPLADFFRRFREAGFTGPISIHFEYEAYEEASEEGKLEQMTKAVRLVRREMRKAGWE